MCIRNPRLPMLPGYGTNTMIGRTKFGNKPIFTTIDGVNMLIDKDEGDHKIPSIYARKQTPELPAWIMYDKNILRFEAYYQETLQEVHAAASKYRKVDIFFYLEDGTMKVIEKRTENSGTWQGCIITRQRIRLPFSYDLYYDVLDLIVGREITIFGKVFKIVSCDKFTRHFMNRLGIHQPDPLNWPDAPDTKRPEPVVERHFSLKQFLENDGKVLRFFGYWDDRSSEGGTLHKLVIYYFLCDDTMQISEDLPENSGQELGSTLLRRTRIPKKKLPFTVMSGEPPPPMYTPVDLSIGAVLNIYGRKVVITNLDSWTRDYYRKHYGMESFEPLPTPKDDTTECIGRNLDERELPPWNGYGSYEDSAGNCRSVELKPPHIDSQKFFYKDKIGFDSHVLRFSARLISDYPENERRYFIVKYFLADDNIAIFELGERNSGFKGGNFYKRAKMYLPGADFYAAVEPPAYTDKDMWVGNELVINHHRFRLTGADEYALRYMELHNQEYPMANVILILDKIRRRLVSEENAYKNFVTKYMNATVPQNKDLMTVRCFKQALKEIMCEKMSEHEYLTLIRHFRGDIGAEKNPRKEMIRSLIFSDLVRGLWDDRTALLASMIHADETRQGRISIHRLKQVLKSNRLPISADLMECMVSMLDKDENCNVTFDEVMNFLDFQTNPVIHLSDDDYNKVVRHSVPVNTMLCKVWADNDLQIGEGYVNWSAFLCQLNMDHVVKMNEQA